MKRVILTGAFALAAVIAMAETRNGTKTEAPAKSENVVGQSGTAVFLFNGIAGQENDPSKYEDSPVTNPSSLCQGSAHRCAATFQLDDDGERTGNPQAPTYNKN
ncbi:MAG TPA: hypothetical protein VN040_14055 [Pseudosphingobacterium sp.]|nr:hypothetical protein [Pseudosphingobacterium sp.]